jgi:phosphatidylserine decarboxylase
VIVNTFLEWVGDVRSANPFASVVMDSPKEVRAVWTRDYSRLFVVIAYFALMIAVGALVVRRIRTYSRRRLLARRKATATS